MTDITAEAWGEKYRASRGVYESLSQRLQDLFRDILRDAEVSAAQIEGRAKKVDSFVEKIYRKESRYSDPITDMTDLVGIRLIVYYREDVSKVCELIEQEFNIDRDNSVDKSTGLDVDRFGYVSVHYVATLADARSKLREWKIFKGIKFEIQVRTVLQHAWAAVDHKLNYKSKSAAPAELQRNLFRLSALFELADEQFSMIHRDSQRIVKEYKNEVSGGNFDLPLNILSLQAYLEQHPQISATRKMLVDHGINIREEPESSKALDDQLDQAVRVMRALGITSLSDLDKAVKNDIPNTLEFINKENSHRILVLIVGLLAISHDVIDRKAYEEALSSNTWARLDALRSRYIKKMQSSTPAIPK